MGHLNPVGYLVHKIYNPSLDLVARRLFLTDPRGHSSSHPVATIQWPTTWFERQMRMPLASWYIRPKDTVTPKRTWMLFPQSLPYFWDFSEKTKNVLFLGTYTFLFNCKESSISKQSQGGRSRLSIEWQGSHSLADQARYLYNIKDDISVIFDSGQKHGQFSFECAWNKIQALWS